MEKFDQAGNAGEVRTVLVLGMGATGASCARHLAGRGQGAWFADTRVSPPAAAAIRAAMPEAGLICGELPGELPPGVAQVIVSPGVDLQLPILASARRRGIPLLSDIDLFMAQRRAPVVGITGSNGKSTVTTMVGAILAAAGRRAGVGGNLGTPALDLLDSAADSYVLELSSFQLERSAAMDLASAVVLNVAADHLDKHGTMAAYTAAKARIYARAAVAIVNRDERSLVSLVPRGSKVVEFGLDTPRGGHYGVRGQGPGALLVRGDEPLLAVGELGTTGRHNVSNALAAAALAHSLGAPDSACVAALRAFRGLPHRMQTVAVTDGVTWMDDSKATNVAAAVTSVGSTEGPLILIGGGDGKGQTFEDLATALRGRNAAVILIGRDREMMATALAAVATVELVASLPAAVRRARALAQPGTTVLLAPACSSLDMFRSYEHRGQVFASAVLEAAP
ncbi:MAG: UDP-N-acetylmuramoyl-L-alanine--D-glutamate ligase [Gammaproteobacteria bacterium]|nr:UDP-N-acetylmuramoyl-L-alanine--D-glutamate ligase [Gammaproteobacteria bacterium]